MLAINISMINTFSFHSRHYFLRVCYIMSYDEYKIRLKFHFINVKFTTIVKMFIATITAAVFFNCFKSKDVYIYIYTSKITVRRQSQQVYTNISFFTVIIFIYTSSVYKCRWFVVTRVTTIQARSSFRDLWAR